MHFDHSKIFVTKFALEFTEFQMFQPSARPSAFSCIDLRQPKAKPKVRNLRLRQKTLGLWQTTGGGIILFSFYCQSAKTAHNSETSVKKIHNGELSTSGLPKAKGLRPKSKVSHLRLPLRLPKVYAAEGRRSSRGLKLLKFSKFKCKSCDKNFRMIKVHVCSVIKYTQYVL